MKQKTERKNTESLNNNGFNPETDGRETQSEEKRHLSPGERERGVEKGKKGRQTEKDGERVTWADATIPELPARITAYMFAYVYV